MRLTEIGHLTSGDLYRMEMDRNLDGVAEWHNKPNRSEVAEDEFGIDLLTLLKALKQGYVWAKTNAGAEKSNGFSVVGTELWSQTRLDPREYGKTWALTREELG